MTYSTNKFPNPIFGTFLNISSHFYQKIPKKSASVTENPTWALSNVEFQKKLVRPFQANVRSDRMNKRGRNDRRKGCGTKFYLVEKVPHVSPKSGNRIGTEVDRIKKFLQNGVGNHIDKNRVLLGRGINFQLSGHVFLNPSGR